MPARPFPDAVDVLALKYARDYLAADSDMAAFFGIDRILVNAGHEVLPYVDITMGSFTDEMLPARKARTRFPVSVKMYLPAATSTVDAMPIPDAPVGAPGASGSLSGKKRYGLTCFDARGESYVSKLSDPVDVTAQKVDLTYALPADMLGGRLFRTDGDDRTYAKHLRTITDPTETTWTDDLTDSGLADDLAPDPQLEARLARAVLKAFSKSGQTESLSDPNTTAPTVDFVAALKSMTNTPVDEWNRRCVEVIVEFQRDFDRRTGL